jgi:hypothetical protein
MLLSYRMARKKQRLLSREKFLLFSRRPDGATGEES